MDIESEILFARLQIEELQNTYAQDESERLAIREQQTYLQELIADLERELHQAPQSITAGRRSPTPSTSQAAEVTTQIIQIGGSSFGAEPLVRAVPCPPTFGSMWTPPWANVSRHSSPDDDAQIRARSPSPTNPTLLRASTPDSADSPIPSPRFATPGPSHYAQTAHAGPSTSPRPLEARAGSTSPAEVDLQDLLGMIIRFGGGGTRSRSNSPPPPPSPPRRIQTPNQFLWERLTHIASEPHTPSLSGTATPSNNAPLSNRQAAPPPSNPVNLSGASLSENIPVNDVRPIARAETETTTSRNSLSDLLTTLLGPQPTSSSGPSSFSAQRNASPLGNGQVVPNIGSPIRSFQATRPTSSEVVVRTDFETLFEAIDSSYSSPPMSSISYRPSAYTSSSESVLPSQPCVSCTETVSPAIEMPCHHFLCRTCLLRQIRHMVYKDHFAYPFRCCKDYPVADAKIKPLLPVVLRADFEALSNEMSIPLLERMYCANPRCASFLGRTSHQAIQSCSACGTFTCTRCKHQWSAARHRNCPGPDAPDQALAQLAATKKWQKCFRCHTTVEQTPGCDHIQCICGAEFCYACGSKWKTCPCPYWVEGRLVEANLL